MNKVFFKVNVERENQASWYIAKWINKMYQMSTFQLLTEDVGEVLRPRVKLKEKSF